MNNPHSLLYTQPVLDFIAVCTEYCKSVEQPPRAMAQRRGHLTLLRRLLALVYLRATLLPDVPETDGRAWHTVTEADYDYVRQQLSHLLGAADTYLDTFRDDFRYADQPIACSLSEDLADVYQSLRDLIETFRLEEEEAMATALAAVADDFMTGWGGKLLSALRALHDAALQDDDNEEYPS